jgi:DNA-binding MarR family transcriptional regulator
LLSYEFRKRGFAEVRPAYGSILIPLFEEDGLRMGQLAERARLSKQTMTTLVRLTERDGLVMREPDPSDGRAALVWLTDRGRAFQPVADRAVKALERRVGERLTTDQIGQLKSALSKVADL